MKVVKNSVIAVMFVFALCIAAQAGEPEEPDMRGKVRERIEKMMMWRISEEMKLPPEKEEALFKLIKAHFREREEVTRRQFEVIGQLEELYRQNAPTEELKRALDDFERVQEERVEIEMRLRDELRRILTTREIVRFIITWPKVEEEIRSMIHQFKKGKPQRGKNKPK
ncbi:MAG: hypothetical protein AB1546_16580 [bacterium]